MARTVGDINRACTPIHYIEESLDQSQEKLREQKKQLEEEQKINSPFLVGSIEEVNRRISNLDQKLQSYTELTIESRASERSEDIYVPPPSAKAREIHQKREQETKEVNRFAGIYSIKSTFLNKPNERIKNVSKISMDPSKTSVKKDTGKPKFVELHQYPGYEPTELTPLPHGLTAVEVLSKVAGAQRALKHKSAYKPEFERLFYSQMSQAVLQDTFWWLFLDKWQSTPGYQQKLFNRVAHNYVKLMTYAKNPQYRETFFRNYQSLLAQSVYAAYCAAFPDSYRMFGEEFKEDLVALVYEWIAGSRPSPRIWLNWNFEELEPHGLKQRENLIKQAKAKKSSSLSLDFLDFVTTSQYSQSQSTLNQVGSSSSTSSFTTASPSRHHGKKRHPSPRKPQPSSSGTTDISGAINEVSEAQEVSTDSKKRSVKPKIVRESAADTLEPITEQASDGHIAAKDSKVSFAQQTPRMSARESHPLGKGPDFCRSAFNIHGRSPLVAQFLRMKNLRLDSGTKSLIHRTEMTNLPSMDAKTYKDLIDESYKKVRQTERKYDKLVEKDKAEQQKFSQRQKQDLAEHKKREAVLLSNRHEVKKLSDLIMLELKKDQDSIGAGVGLAIDAALASLEF